MKYALEFLPFELREDILVREGESLVRVYFGMRNFTVGGEDR
jgi:hypothetical protein